MRIIQAFTYNGIPVDLSEEDFAAKVAGRMDPWQRQQFRSGMELASDLAQQVFPLMSMTHLEFAKCALEGRLEKCSRAQRRWGAEMIVSYAAMIPTAGSTVPGVFVGLYKNHEITTCSRRLIHVRNAVVGEMRHRRQGQSTFTSLSPIKVIRRQVDEPDFQRSLLSKRISAISTRTLGVVAGASAMTTGMLAFRSEANDLLSTVFSGLLTGLGLTALGLRYQRSRPFRSKFRNSIEEVFIEGQQHLTIVGLTFYGVQNSSYPSYLNERLFLTLDPLMEQDFYQDVKFVNGELISQQSFCGYEGFLKELEILLPPKKKNNYFTLHLISRLFNRRAVEDMFRKASIFYTQNAAQIPEGSLEDLCLCPVNDQFTLELTVKKTQVFLVVYQTFVLENSKTSKREPLEYDVTVHHDLLKKISTYTFGKGDGST